MTAGRFPVDADVRRAGTIDHAVYSDPRLHAALLERAFVPSWQLVPLGAPRRAVEPFVLLPDALDEPLVLARDDAGVERVLSNVCTHRAALVAEAACDPRELRCPYHGRRFALDGRFVHAPEFEGAEDFPRPADDLARAPLERLGPLRFTTLGDAPPFAEWSGPARALLSPFEGEDLVFAPERSRVFEVGASWALYVENYLEGFHVPWVHPGLARSLDFGSYRTELVPGGVRQVGIARDGEPCLQRPGGTDEAGVAGDYLWLFPNLMLNAYPWGLSVNLVEPAGPDRCRVRYLTFVARPDRLDAGAGGDLGTVEAEDDAIVELCQRGVRARLYAGGRFAPSREVGPHAFHRLLSDALEGVKPPEPAPGGQAS